MFGIIMIIILLEYEPKQQIFLIIILSLFKNIARLSVDMQTLKQQTIKALNNLKPKQGITRLFELMEQYGSSQNHSSNIKQFQIVYLSCLGLLQIEHDWQNLKKYMIQWNLVDKMAPSIVQRMKQRVAEEYDLATKPIQNRQERQAHLIREMDRLFHKYWQFNSPKKQAPNYEHIRRQYRKKQLKKDKQPHKQTLKQQAPILKVQKSKQQPITKLSTIDKPQNNYKPRQSAITNVGRSLKLKIGAFGNNNDKKQTNTFNMMNVQRQPVKPLQTVINNSYTQQNLSRVASDRVKNQQQQYPINNNNQDVDFTSHKYQQQPKQQQPTNYIAKPKLKVKYEIDRKDMPAQSDEDFEMSAVRSKQVPHYSHRETKVDIWNSKKFDDFDFEEYQHDKKSRQKMYSHNITNRVHINDPSITDNSFLNDSKFVYRTNQKLKHNSANNDINNQDFYMLKQVDDQYHASKQLDIVNTADRPHSLSFSLCEQKLAMIETHIKPTHHIRSLFERQCITPKQLLTMAIDSM